MAPNRPFPVDPTLTAIAIAYRNPDNALIYRRALPAIDVLSEAFKWTEYPLAQAFTVPDLEVGRLGRVGQITFSGEERDSSVKDYGQDSPIPYSDIREAEKARAQKRSTVDPRGLATQLLTDLIDLGREIRVASVVQDPNNYSADKRVTLAGADQFSNFATSDPYEVIDSAMDSTLIQRPNHIIMGQPVWSKVKRHPKLIKAVKGGLSDEGAITREQFADLFEIPRENLLIGAAYLNAARPGQNPNLNRVWGKHIELVYLNRAKTSSTDGVLTWGFTAEYGTRVSGSIHDPDIGLEGGERVRVGEKTRELVCAKDVGYQIRNAVS